jgi:hypothetical protein
MVKMIIKRERRSRARLGGRQDACHLTSSLLTTDVRRRRKSLHQAVVKRSTRGEAGPAVSIQKTLVRERIQYMSFRPLLLVALSSSLVLAAGCAGANASAGANAGTSQATAATHTRSDGYVSRPETADIRGSCPAGYEQRPDVPEPAFKCIYDSFSPDPVAAKFGVAYPFLVHNHCGVQVEQFDDRVFVADGLYPSGTGPGGGRDAFGTMTLTSQDKAQFQGRAGYVVALHAVSAAPHMPGCD